MSGLPPTLGNLAFLGGYAPRRCGIATFTTDLHQAVATASPKSDCFVVAVTDPLQTYSYGSSVRFELEERDAGSYRRTADSLDLTDADVLSLQHEFGIFDGPSGSYLPGLLREVQDPVVTTLHTILSTPDTAQRTNPEGLACSKRWKCLSSEYKASVCFGKACQKLPNVSPNGPKSVLPN